MISDHKAETCSFIRIWIINLHNRMQSIKEATEILFVYTHTHAAFSYVKVHTVIMNALIVCNISSYLII